jgi:thiol-disulfide isomerase/thioredoxin
VKPILAIAAALLLLAGCGQHRSGADNRAREAKQTVPAAPAQNADEPEGTGRLDRSHAGSPTPSASFENSTGEPLTLADFKGRPVLVNLWATWCGPCVSEMPTLDALAAQQGDRIEVVPISQDGNGREKVEQFFAKGQFASLQPYIDPTLAMMSELKIESLPTTILYDAGGREVWRMVGMEDWQGKRAAALIAEGKS